MEPKSDLQREAEEAAAYWKTKEGQSAFRGRGEIIEEDVEFICARIQDGHLEMAKRGIEVYRNMWLGRPSGDPSGTAGAILTRLQAKGLIKELLNGFNF